jgi:hypothetical protein
LPHAETLLSENGVLLNDDPSTTLECPNACDAFTFDSSHRRGDLARIVGAHASKSVADYIIEVINGSFS